MRTFSSVLVSLLFVATAHAQSGSAQAEQMFRDGKRLMQEQKYAEACAAFEASQKLDPLPTTLLNLADCREKNGQYASAWGLFLEAERQTRGDSSQRAFAKTAKERAAKLEPRLSYLIINVPDESQVDGLTISRNGEPVEPLTWNRALPIDGGEYVIEGKAPGHEPWSTKVTVGAEKDKESVDVPRFKALPAPVLPEPDGGGSGDGGGDDPADVIRVDEGGMSGKRKAAIGLGVGGVVAFGVAGFFELGARGTYDDALAAMDQTERDRLYDDAVSKRKLAIGVGAAGGVLVAGAVFLWVTGGASGDEQDETAFRITPSFGDDGVGVSFSRGW